MLGPAEWRAWKDAEEDADCKKRRLAEAVARLIKFGTFKPYKRKQRNLCILRDGLRRHLARERARRRGRTALMRFAGVAIQAKAEASLISPSEGSLFPLTLYAQYALNTHRRQRIQKVISYRFRIEFFTQQYTKIRTNTKKYKKPLRRPPS